MPSNSIVRYSKRLIPSSFLISFVDVIQHTSKLVYLQQVFKLSENHHGNDFAGCCIELYFNLQVSTLSRVQVTGVSIPTGHIVKHEQRTVLILSPIRVFQHAGLILFSGSTGKHKSEEAQGIPAGIGTIQLQCFVGVFFTSHNLFDALQSKLLEGKGIIGSVPIEGFGIQQAHDHAVGDPVLEDVVFLPTVTRALEGVGSDFSSHHRILGIRRSGSLNRQGLEHAGIQSQLTQHEADFDVLRKQPDALVIVNSGQLGSPIGPKVWIIEEKFQLDFCLRYQGFARVEHFQMRPEHQILGFSHIITRGCF